MVWWHDNSKTMTMVATTTTPPPSTTAMSICSWVGTGATRKWQGNGNTTTKPQWHPHQNDDRRWWGMTGIGIQPSTCLATVRQWGGWDEGMGSKMGPSNVFYIHFSFFCLNKLMFSFFKGFIYVTNATSPGTWWQPPQHPQLPLWATAYEVRERGTWQGGGTWGGGIWWW